ncbi:MAG: nucleotidyltransferase family protein [Planctomycetota bacterium]
MSNTLNPLKSVLSPGWGDVTAVILAGGLGTRLRGVVADRPKCLAPILGRPFLAHQLDWLSSTALSQVLISTGYMAEQVEEAIGAMHQGLSIRYSNESKPLGTGGAVRLAAIAVETPFMLVLNGDSFCNADLNLLNAQFYSNGMAPTMLLTQVPEIARYGQVTCDESHRVRKFLEKGSTGPGWINAGIYLLPTKEVLALPGDVSCSLERDLFPALADQNRLYAHQVKADFIDIGTPESYGMADSFFGQTGKLNVPNVQEFDQAKG